MGDGGFPIDRWSGLNVVAESDAASAREFAGPCLFRPGGVDQRAGFAARDAGAEGRARVFTSYPPALTGGNPAGWSEPEPHEAASDHRARRGRARRRQRVGGHARRRLARAAGRRARRERARRRGVLAAGGLRGPRAARARRLQRRARRPRARRHPGDRARLPLRRGRRARIRRGRARRHRPRAARDGRRGRAPHARMLRPLGAPRRVARAPGLAVARGRGHARGALPAALRARGRARRRKRRRALVGRPPRLRARARRIGSLRRAPPAGRDRRGRPLRRRRAGRLRARQRAVEAYGADGHPVASLALREGAPAANWVRLRGPGREADAHDFAGIARDGARLRLVRDDASSGAAARARAAAALARARREERTGLLVAPFTPGRSCSTS